MNYNTFPRNGIIIYDLLLSFFSLLQEESPYWSVLKVDIVLKFHQTRVTMKIIRLKSFPLALVVFFFFFFYHGNIISILGYLDIYPVFNGCDLF